MSPNSPADESHYYYDALRERAHELDERFGARLNWRIYQGGYKHITWEVREGVGYECDDEVALEIEANAVARDMESLIRATEPAIAGLTPYEERGV